MKNFRPVHLRKYNMRCSSEDITINKDTLPGWNGWKCFREHSVAHNWL